MKEIVNSEGFSFGIITDENIKNKYLSEGGSEVSLCIEIFYRKKWDFENKIWIEGATKEEIQQQELEQKKILKQQQYEELLPTDWYIVRFIERGIEIPKEILQQRQAIREKYE